MSTATQGRTGVPAPSWRLPALWLASVVVLGCCWIAGVLVPYHVNGLDSLSLDELTSGAWDPARLWPADAGAIGQAVHAAGAFVGWPLMHVVHIASAVGSGCLLAQEWSTSGRGERVLLVALASLSTALTVLLLSPFGIALSTWALD